MSYAVACARPTVFRAVAVLSGANLSGCNGGTQPVAYFGIHGIHDSVLNISQGRSMRDTFVRNNGCTSQSPQEPAWAATHIITTYWGCRAGYPVSGWRSTATTPRARWTGRAAPTTPGPGPLARSGGSSRPCPAPHRARRRLAAAVFTSAVLPAAVFTSASSPPPSSPPPSSPPPSQGPAGCAAAYTVASNWPGGFQAGVVVSNTGSSAISGWRVSWTLASGQKVTQVWNGSLTTSGSAVTVANAAYNGAIAPGASTNFGLLADGSPGSAPTLTCTRA